MSDSIVSVLDAKIEETEQELAQITERAEKLEDVLMNLRTAREILGDAEGVKPPPGEEEGGEGEKAPSPHAVRRAVARPSQGRQKGRPREGSTHRSTGCGTSRRSGAAQ